MIPSDLKDFLPYPKTPWEISQGVKDRLEPTHKRFKSAVILPSDPEAAFILRYFMKGKPPGFSIGKITCIYNRSLASRFTAQLAIIEEEAHKFHPSTTNEQLLDQRQKVTDRWKSLTQIFSPFEVMNDEETEALDSVKILPLWHGTSLEKSRSISESGFTYFGKHAYFQGHQGPGSTDIGFFGSGIYFTDSAQYASLYSKGYLLLSWVSMREPYPVVSDKPHPKNSNEMKTLKSTDMITLEGKGAYQNYDAHFIPVASVQPDNPKCMVYLPCYQNQKPAWDEIVVFQQAQTLPSFIIQVEADLIHSPANVYSFDTCYAATLAGDLSQLEAWIIEDPKRLQEENAQGENFLYAAILGNQLPSLKWLYNQNSFLLKKCRNDGWTLMHIAAAEGHAPIITWLHEKDPLMIQCAPGGHSPLHIAVFSEQISVLQLFVEQIKTNISLIEEIAQRPCLKTLAFLFDQGLSPNFTNKFKQTLLHFAAGKGQVANIEFLLERGVDLNAQDLSMKTALYLATAQGHLSAVKCLLEKGADPTIFGIEGDDILHVAAFYGYTPILQLLLTHPNVKNLLHFPDDDGKQPIHKAVWIHPKPDVVRLLLESGADPNAKNKWDYTPLHWAAKHGHIDSAEILLKAGAQLDVTNKNHDLPFDLAIRWGQDAFVRFFLGAKQKTEIGELPKDVESFYHKKLIQAKKENNFEEQVFYLEKLSDLYIEKKDWVKGAKILNCALAILEKNLNNSLFQKYLFARLERIEALFLESKGFKISSGHRNFLIKTRYELRNGRGICIEKFKQGEAIAKVLPILTKFYQTILANLIYDSIKLLGIPPTQWSCIGMGSMARGEMCPYSDIEFAFIIEKKTEGTLAYFRILAQLLEIKIINLGETKFPIFGECQESPTPGGFSMDSGGNTPLGKPGFYELIDTPEGLAQFQCQHWMDADIIVTNALSSVCHVAGNRKFTNKYYEAKKKQLNITDGVFSFTGIAFREKLALKLLTGNLIEFKPNLSKQKQETKAFGIKKELYRPFQSILGSLAIFYGIEAESSLTVIDVLLKKGIISSIGEKNLKKAIKQVLALRCEAHVFYQKEEEFLLQIEENKIQDSHFLYLDEKRLPILHEIFKVLIPFHLCAEEFLSTKSQEVFKNKIFYDDSPVVQGKAFEKTLQYAKAQEAFQQAVSLNPNDISALLELGNMGKILGKGKDALTNKLQALTIARKRYGEIHHAVATSYHDAGGIYDELGEHSKALEYNQKALKISLQLFGENHPDVAVGYNSNAIVLAHLGEYKKALEYYQKSLEIFLFLYGENHSYIALVHNSMSILYQTLGKYEKSLEHVKKGLEIRLKLLGENHPDVAKSLNNIGSIHGDIGDYKEALICFQRALKIRINFFGENHPDVAIIYNNMCGIYQKLNNINKALKYSHKTLQIQQKILHATHPELITTYSNLGALYSELGNPEKAMEYNQKAQTLLQSLGENNLDLARIYGTRGLICKSTGNYIEALEYSQKALQIFLQTFGENHPDVATAYQNTGVMYDAQGDDSNALDCYQKALKIKIEVLEKNHPSFAITYDNIGGAYQKLKDYKKALEYFEKSLQIQLQVPGNKSHLARIHTRIGVIYYTLWYHEKALEHFQKALEIQLQEFGENHPDVITSYHNIGSTYQNLKKYEKALENMQTVLRIQLQIFEENHPKLITSYKNIAVIYESLGNEKETKKYIEKSQGKNK